MCHDSYQFAGVRKQCTANAFAWLSIFSLTVFLLDRIWLAAQSEYIHFYLALYSTIDMHSTLQKISDGFPTSGSLQS